jgi:hypothetical protein
LRFFEVFNKKECDLWNVWNYKNEQTVKKIKIKIIFFQKKEILNRKEWVLNKKCVFFEK